MPQVGTDSRILVVAPAKTLQGPDITVVADAAQNNDTHSSQGSFETQPLPRYGWQTEQVSKDDSVRAAMADHGNAQRLTSCGCIPNREFLTDARMDSVMGEYGLNRGRHATVKVAESFASGKALPSLLQFASRRSSEIGIHFRLSQILKDGYSDFFEIVDDFRLELMSRGYRPGRFSRPAQWTAVERMNGAPAEISCSNRCLLVPQLRQSGIPAGLIPLPVRFAVADQYKFEREVFARARFTLFLCHDA